MRLEHVGWYKRTKAIERNQLLEKVWCVLPRLIFSTDQQDYFSPGN